VSNTYQRIYAAVRRIPKGQVATYGQVARLAGLPGHARQVGYALHALPAVNNVPWQRVVNAKGEISRRVERHFEEMQRKLLEREKVKFGLNGKISLARFQWRPRFPTPKSSMEKIFL
jgi:methylated-DNA-protein-cysteine methyltransferase related protein